MICDPSSLNATSPPLVPPLAFFTGKDPSVRFASLEAHPFSPSAALGIQMYAHMPMFQRLPDPFLLVHPRRKAAGFGDSLKYSVRASPRRCIQRLHSIEAVFRRTFCFPFPVACLHRVTYPDGWGQHPVPYPHLCPPREPHRDQQVRINLNLVPHLASNFICLCFRTGSMLEVLMAYTISTGALNW